MSRKSVNLGRKNTKAGRQVAQQARQQSKRPIVRKTEQ